ncbi:hypothetical protein PL75_09990 [Neisseria arctica]|uniref:DUF3465 domain-containing protein n=2 Tax=Neisseria arctica TaxID=1470200 RepID=A0A0J1C1E9_9NEIS|nr:hypothetical protein PL75_09990 [Neisseria arctica]
MIGMKKNWIVIVSLAVAVSAYLYWQKTPKDTASLPQGGYTQQNTVEGNSVDGSDIIQKAFRNQQSGIQVRGEGTVAKTLPDDNKGSRHQRFILKLTGNHTVLVAHNIDLAPKIKGLKKGDKVEFYGVYEWSDKGGVIHWTHHDPQGRHIGGWLKHQGQIFE